MVNTYPKTAIIGATGQLGSDMINAFGKDAVALSHQDIEVRDIDSCRRTLKGAGAIINCAAYVAVDESETHPEDAFAINAIGARNVAMVSSEYGIKNVYISTDFVFDGRKKSPYNEDDSPNPINTYGLSKYAGEIFTRNICKSYYIIRTCGIYGKTVARGKGANFVSQMIKKAGNNERIEVVNDMIVSPTYTKDVADAARKIMAKGLPYGIYHAANGGKCSWFEFSKKIFELLNIDAKLFPITTRNLGRKAARPKLSALESKKLEKCGIKMRPWDAALKEYLDEYRRD